jgi:predicted nucleic acid-binding protein
MSSTVADHLVLDASAMVDLLAGTTRAEHVATKLMGATMHAPAHFDAEVLSALGRLHRAGHLTPRAVATRLTKLATAPIQRHALHPLVIEAWKRRAALRLVDALYVALADQIDAPLLTTDAALAAVVARAELIG